MFSRSHLVVSTPDSASASRASVTKRWRRSTSTPSLSPWGSCMESSMSTPTSGRYVGLKQTWRSAFGLARSHSLLFWGLVVKVEAFPNSCQTIEDNFNTRTQQNVVTLSFSKQRHFRSALKSTAIVKRPIVGRRAQCYERRLQIMWPPQRGRQHGSCRLRSSRYSNFPMFGTHDDKWKRLATLMALGVEMVSSHTDLYWAQRGG